MKKMAFEDFKLPEEIERNNIDPEVHDAAKILVYLSMGYYGTRDEHAPVEVPFLEEQKTEEEFYNERPLCGSRRRRRISDYVEVEEDGEDYGDKAAAAVNKKRRRCSNDNIKNNKKAAMDDGPQPPPPLPEDFKKVIQELAGGRHTSEEKLVIQKGLYETDLSRTQNRLSIPFTKVCDHGFLTEEEAHLLTTRDEKNKMKYKDVTIIEPSLRLEQVKLTRWDMNKNNGRNASSHYVINGKWSDIVERNKFTYGEVVQIWSFRINHALHFALVKVVAP